MTSSRPSITRKIHATKCVHRRGCRSMWESRQQNAIDRNVPSRNGNSAVTGDYGLSCSRKTGYISEKTMLTSTTDKPTFAQRNHRRPVQHTFECRCLTVGSLAIIAAKIAPAKLCSAVHASSDSGRFAPTTHHPLLRLELELGPRPFINQSITTSRCHCRPSHAATLLNTALKSA